MSVDRLPDPLAPVEVVRYEGAAAAEVALVRSRLSAAEVPVDERAEGFAVRDPAGIAVVITHSN